MIELILGKKINGVRVVPISTKIILIFTLILLISNFSTHFISLVMNRGEITKYVNRELIRDLKDLHVFLTNQRDIYLYTGDLDKAVEDVKASARWNLRNESSIALAWSKKDGFLFIVPDDNTLNDSDLQSLEDILSEKMQQNINEGPIYLNLHDGSYFGAFKYNKLWDLYLFKGENTRDLYASSVRNFIYISIMIVLISLLCMAVGIYILRHLLRFVSRISKSIMDMQLNQDLTLIDLDGAVNDDVTYLGMAFNSLSITISNLLNIFKKFVARDIAANAYKEKEIRLEGNKRSLTILFTDIKRFTNITEVLGTDIIKLLNLHYEQAIKIIHEYDGDIGSIIGDALLAIFGVMKGDQVKSLHAVKSGYEILHTTARLRESMKAQEKKILETKGFLSPEEQRVLDAVMLEVGVGIDGGEVFYGNIGSNERMVNTVIGDNVNSSSRLEGLTRFYKVPIITSQYVKEEVENISSEYCFIELDRVVVKGKTEGKCIYWPVEVSTVDDNQQTQIDLFREALQLYYIGDWGRALELFRKCTLEPAVVFKERIESKNPPEDWNGIWTMKEK